MTTSLDKLTGNEDGSQAILKLILETRSEDACTYEAVAATAGELFGTAEPLSQEEYIVGVQMIEQLEAEPASTAANVAVEDAAPVMSRDAAQARLKELQEQLFCARKSRQVAETEQARAREAMAATILEWSQGGESKDAIRKREIEAINSDRGRGVERANERRPGPSRIDQQAFYSAGGNGNDYARKQHRFGSHHRATALVAGGPLLTPGRRGLRVPSEG